MHHHVESYCVAGTRAGCPYPFVGNGAGRANYFCLRDWPDPKTTLPDNFDGRCIIMHIISFMHKRSC